jgi:catechol 2,3-dioxygenase-like lactoylglutathione lyase family enzyme
MSAPVLDHVSLKVSDIERSVTFYREALGTLGIGVLMDFEYGGTRHVGFGRDKPDFWIANGRQTPGETHVAFKAASRAEVQAFYSVGISVGGRDNGPPGIRAHYHPDYYGAFVLDPDGNNVEAVCHKPEATP